jgi:SAM-dependent methyltransferase
MPKSEVPPRFHRSGYQDQERAAVGARFLERHVCDALSLRDLSDCEVLDVGCGTKFTYLFLNEGVPVKSYVGVDVYGEMVEFLSETVTDPRFEYHHIDVHNELYNPDAPPMSASTDLGVGDRTFDLIWLFSVFTHLNPADFRIMLELLRRYVRPTGTLFFTAFLNERSATDHGVVEQLTRAIEQAIADGSVPPEVLAEMEAKATEPEGYVDMDPSNPLRYAIYSRDHALELIAGTGWHVQAILEPNEFAQHQFVCTPVDD